MLAEFSLTVKMNTINLLNQTTILVSNTSFFMLRSGETDKHMKRNDLNAHL